MREGIRDIREVAAGLGLAEEELELYGRFKAKLTWDALRRAMARPRGRLVYVTAMTPTPAGEGKTTVAIGLTQALAGMGLRAAVCLREPSLGPVFGLKGGGTGTGRARLVPAEDINLHFTGDLHAVAAAHNLLAALVDNHLHHGLAPPIDPKRVWWRRVLDVNDRALRRIVVGLGGPGDGVTRESGFDITAASEVMAVLCLSRHLSELKGRLARMVVAERAGGPGQKALPYVTAADVGAVGAMAVLLRDALRPNLAQTVEGQPAFVHGGPFANIAHGNNSLVATLAALGLADWVVTEGGFGSDLGAEKFFHIVAPQADVQPDVTVLVATLRALRYHGGVAVDRVHEPNPQALEKGLQNLDRHVTNLRDLFGLPVVVAVNRFAGDEPEELRRVVGHCRDELGVAAAVCDVVQEGGAGGLELAQAVLQAAARGKPRLRAVYRWEEPLADKLEKLAVQVYGADGVEFSPPARRMVDELAERGFGGLPVCVAKTQYSFSDDPRLRGVPVGWRLRVTGLRPAAGAGFVVALCGDVLTMPGLPREPAAVRMDVDEEGFVVGLS